MLIIYNTFTGFISNSFTIYNKTIHDLLYNKKVLYIFIATVVLFPTKTHIHKKIELFYFHQL